MATSNWWIAAAVEAHDQTQDGTAVLIDPFGGVKHTFEVGNLPDSLAFSANGRYLVVANEAEPLCTSDGVTVDKDEGGDLLVDPRARSRSSIRGASKCATPTSRSGSARRTNSASRASASTSPGAMRPRISSRSTCRCRATRPAGPVEDDLGVPDDIRPSGTDRAGVLVGARSLSIWDERGKQVFDSGDDFAQILSDTPYFNLDDDEIDGRSDDRAAEPEAIAVGSVGWTTYAFVGLERSGGIMMYDITNPRRAKFVQYLSTAELCDVGPEAIAFVPAWQSPTWKPLLLPSFEVSGTTRFIELS